MNDIVSLLLVLTTGIYLMYSVFLLLPEDPVSVLSWVFIVLLALVGWVKVIQEIHSHSKSKASSEGKK